MPEDNPKILHRIYFNNYPPYHDPYEHFLESWRREMPDYEIKIWNASNLDININEWTREAAAQQAPVFLAEYFRWHVLREYGGVYLDADCEILNGQILRNLIEDLYAQDRYDTFFGVEERSNGFPTAQTVGARKNSKLVAFMADLYERRLAPLWPWREERGLIGPQLMALYYLNDGINTSTRGFFPNLDRPLIVKDTKVYPQIYFSPKFALDGKKIDYDRDKTCVYHMFANSNITFERNSKAAQLQARPLTFEQLRERLDRHSSLPCVLSPNELETVVGLRDDGRLVSHGVTGTLSFGPYLALPKGHYEAKLECETLAPGGMLEVRVTAERGAITLASQQIMPVADADQAGRTLTIPFSIGQARLSDIEVLTVVDETARVALSSLSFAIGARKPVPRTIAPTILHRVYFGFDGKPDVFSRYLETWSEQLPDFEIRHWNATNLDLQANKFVEKCYEERDHAFLTDYFRWRILHDHGGIYLDADTEIVNGEKIRKLVHEMNVGSGHDAVIGIDQRSGGWYTAHSMISKPGSKISEFMCNLYDNFGSFVNWRKKGFYFWAPQLVGLYFAENGHNRDRMGTTPDLDAPTTLAEVRILPQDWFSPLSPSGDAAMPFKLDALTENTALCHHFACSWHSADSIYLSHSQEKGGQAQALLSDIVRALPAGQSVEAVMTSLMPLLREDGSIVEFIEQAYSIVFGREADPAGSDYYAYHLAEGLRRRDMVGAMIQSSEFHQRYGTRIQDQIGSWWIQSTQLETGI